MDSLFQIGKEYEITLVRDGRSIEIRGIVEVWSHPLIKLADGRSTGSDNLTAGGVIPGEIINTSSAMFVSAVMIA